MKLLKYLAAATIAMAIIVIVAYLYRDSIARQVANRALRDQNISVAGLSVDSIGRDVVKFSEIVLEQGDGSLIRIRGTSLPLDLSSPRPSELFVDSVSLEQSSIDRPPPALAILLRTFLDTPAVVANTTVHIEQLLIPGIPSIANIHWQSGDSGQRLELDIEPFSFSIETVERTDTGYIATVSVLNADSSEASASSLNIERLDDSLVVEGTTRVDLKSWLPVYHRLGVVPEGVVALDAVVGGPVKMRLFDDANVETVISAELEPEGQVSVEYAPGGESSVQLRAVAISPVQTRFAYPSLDWSAAIESAELRVSNDIVDELPVEVSDVRCMPGIVCTLDAATESGPVTISGWTINTIAAAAMLTIQTEGGTAIEISHNSRFSLGELSNAGTRISSVRSAGISGAGITINDGGWHLRAASLALNVSELTTDAGVTASFPAELTSLVVGNSAADTSAHYEIASDAMDLEFDGVKIAVPATAGDFQIDGDTIESRQSLSASDGSVTAEIDIAHNTGTDEGSMRIQNALLILDTRPLSQLLPSWPYEWDLVGGSLGASGSIQWNTGEEEQYGADVTVSLLDVEGTNDESAFAGLASEFRLGFESSRGFMIDKSTLTIDLLDVGVPMEEVVVNFSLPIEEPVLAIDALSLSLLGGGLFADPFRFDPQGTNSIVLNVRSVQLQFIVGILEFEKLSMQGSVSGRLPMTMTTEQITIDAGRLESDAPGGVIRYGSAGTNLSAADDRLGLVSRALANFQFEALNSDVSYNDTGDLILSMRLEGVNPDMDATQPVILNLNVENNIPQMLKSLRATRSIEEILEKKVAN